METKNLAAYYHDLTGLEAYYYVADFMWALQRLHMRSPCRTVADTMKYFDFMTRIIHSCERSP